MEFKEWLRAWAEEQYGYVAWMPKTVRHSYWNYILADEGQVSWGAF